MVFYLKQSVLVSLALSFGMVNALTGEGKFLLVMMMPLSFSQELSATWYTPNGGLGACGAPIQNSEHIVALSSDQYVAGSSCGRRIRVNCMSPRWPVIRLIEYSCR